MLCALKKPYLMRISSFVVSVLMGVLFLAGFSCSASTLIPSDLLQNNYHLAQKDLSFLQEKSEALLSEILREPCSSKDEKRCAVKGVPDASSPKPRFYVFVSLSMPMPGLMDLARQASSYGGVLVLRGLLEGSYKKTAFYLKEFIEKTGTGVIIDPLLFREYHIQTVPSLVLASSSGKNFDKVHGFIPVKTALETIASQGDLREEANQLLQNKALISSEKEKRR